MKSNNLVAFFQHMPPYPAAVSMRGDAFAKGVINDDFFSKHYNFQLFTTTESALIIPGVTITTLPVAEIENTKSLKRRILGELALGWTAGRKMFTDSKTIGALISSPAYLAACIISTFAKVKNVPYVLDLRDVYPQVYAAAGLLNSYSLLYKILAAISSGMYRNAAAIIVATDGLKQMIEDATNETPVIRIYNGFPNKLLQVKFPKHKKFTVCFHGVLGFMQDVETLRFVAERLVTEDIDVIVIGYGRKVNLLTNNPPRNLRFLGHLPFEQTIKEVARCQIGLSLRLDDNVSRIAFPVKVWEYLGLRIPSIVTPHCEAGDFLENEKCGFQLPAGDVDSIVSRIIELKKSPSTFESMISRSEQVAPNFTREILGKIAGEYITKALGIICM